MNKIADNWKSCLLDRFCCLVKGKKMKDIPFYRLGNFMFDTQKQTLTIGDKATKLTTKVAFLN